MFKHLGNSTQIFAHALFGDYCSPDGLKFDFIEDGNEPFVDDKTLTANNA